MYVYISTAIQQNSSYKYLAHSSFHDGNTILTNYVTAVKHQIILH